jgi:hypothetical protein
MAKTSTKRRSILIASLIVAVLVVSTIGAVFYLLTYDNVTVSGQAGAPTAEWGPALSIQAIEFQDTQAGTVTTFHFHFDSQGYHQFGNYSVTLKNGNTYNVYISFSVMSPSNNIQKEFSTTFIVNVAAGQTTINKDF